MFRLTERCFPQAGGDGECSSDGGGCGEGLAVLIGRLERKLEKMQALLEERLDCRVSQVLLLRCEPLHAQPATLTLTSLARPPLPLGSMPAFSP